MLKHFIFSAVGLIGMSGAAFGGDVYRQSMRVVARQPVQQVVVQEYVAPVERVIVQEAPAVDYCPPAQVQTYNLKQQLLQQQAFTQRYVAPQQVVVQKQVQPVVVKQKQRIVQSQKVQAVQQYGRPGLLGRVRNLLRGY